MESILGLHDKLPLDSAPTADFSTEYLEAVNTSRFVKGFGITALISSLLSLLGTEILGFAIGLGICLFILRYGDDKFYRIVGKSSLIVSLVPLVLVSSMFLIAFVLAELRDWVNEYVLLAGIFGIGMLNVLTSLGVGTYMILRGRDRLFLTLGICVMIAGILQIPSMSLLIISGAVLGKGLETLSILIQSEKSDDDWRPAYTRSLIGVICSGISLGIIVSLALLSYLRE